MARRRCGRVAQNSAQIADGLDRREAIPVRVVWKPVVQRTLRCDSRRLHQASATDKCVGVIAWMHTSRRARMWIGGPTGPHEAASAPAHAVQPSISLGARSTWTS